MADKLYVNVSRNREDEEGYRSTELFWRRGSRLTVSTQDKGGQDVEEAYRQTMANRWIPTPFPVTSAEDTGDYAPVGDTEIVEMTRLDLGSAGILVTNEGTATEDWQVSRTAGVETQRGFFLDFFCYEPENALYFSRAFKVEWGTKWRLQFIGNVTTPGSVVVEERIDGEWQIRAVSPMLIGPLHGQPHKLWVQPLGEDEFMVVNRDDETRGIVVVTEHPIEYDPDTERADDEDYVEGLAKAPWIAGGLLFSGYSRTFWVYRDVQFAAAWDVRTTGSRKLPYLSTQDVDTTGLDAYLPEGDSRYAAAMTVYEGDTQVDEWEADVAGQDEFNWVLTVTGPEDAATGYSKRAVVINAAPIEWPATTVDDEASAVDLFTIDGVSVLGLDEFRDEDDLGSRLSFSILADIDYVGDYLRPNDRVQWVIEYEIVDPPGIGAYVRFDGLIDSAQVNRIVLADGTYKAVIDVTCLTRWRQLRFARYRGGVPLDGLTRTEAYTKVAAQMPMDTATELLIGTLDEDDPLPKARPGEEPAWLPQVGTSLARVLTDLKEAYGPNDRIMWRDVSGVPKLTIEQPSMASWMTFYRSSADALAAYGDETAAVRGFRKDALLQTETDDTEFYNEIWVMGRQKVYRDGEGTVWEPIVAYYLQPRSWKDNNFAQYINIRKPLFMFNPELNTAPEVQKVCLNLAQKFAFFQERAQWTGQFAYGAYPGDRVTLDAGDDPLMSTQQYVIKAMRTRMIALDLEFGKRYETTYDLAVP